MKKIGYNNWLINQQKENTLIRHKKITIFRRYWDVGSNEYKLETQSTINIDDDVIQCGKITWKADTDFLNVWKMGNISLTMDNSHGKWDTENVDGYFNGYTAFLSMVRVEIGFVAQDGTIYEIFSYQGLITDDGIQLENNNNTAIIKIISLDYLLESADAEKVSNKPVSPELQYLNSDIYGATTIGKTGSGWGINDYQYKIVRVTGGTGIGQERMILSNTADTLTVNAWVTTPDVTSDFEIKGEYLGIGNGAQVDYTTTQPGVGKILRLWLDDDYTEQGNAYDVSQLNEATLGAKVTFKIFPAVGVRVIADYIYWYQNQTFKFLIEKILDEVGITNRYIQDVVFPGGVEIEWEQTSQIDWEAGILTQANTTRYSGDIITEDNRIISYRDTYSDTAGLYSPYSNYILSAIGGAWAHSFLAYKSAFVDNFQVYIKGEDSFGLPDGTITMNLCADDAGKPGAILASVGGVLPPISTGIYEWKIFDFTASNYRLVYGLKYWITIYRVALTQGLLYISAGVEGTSEKHASVMQTGNWQDMLPLHFQYKYYYNPYYTWASHISQTLDMGVSVISYGKFTSVETLNNGTAVYYTKSNTIDSFPATWDVAEWDPVDTFGNITSPLRRYLRVAVYFAPNYSGGGVTTSDINTPFISSYIIKYNLTEYKPSLANFTDNDGKSAIETIARLANYEMGFFTDFDDSENMVWDIEYDGTVMPQTVGWTETKTGYSTGVIDVDELLITGETSLASVGSLGVSSDYIISIIEHDGNLYAGSGYNGKVYRYDGGTTWTEVGTLPGVNVQISSLASYDGNLYAGIGSTAGAGVYRYDGGTTWTAVGSPASLVIVKALVIYDGNLYAGGSNGGKIYRYDGGTTWTEVGDTTTPAKQLISFDNNLYKISASDGIIYRYDGGTTWSNIGTIGTTIKAIIEYDNEMYIASGNGVYKYISGVTWEDTGLSSNNYINSLAIYDGRLFAGSVTTPDLYNYNGTSWVYLLNAINRIDVMLEYEDKLYIGTSGTNPASISTYTKIGYCYYEKIANDLDPRNGWTIEANIEKTIGSDEGFRIMVLDGTFKTIIAITNLGYLKLLEYDKDDLTKSKKATFPSGSRYEIKIARKGTMVKIYVNGDVVLISHANAPVETANDKVIYFGQMIDPTDAYQNVIDWLRYNDSIPCFETLYLPKYYFQDRNSIADTKLQLEPDENYIHLYNYQSGWSRIYNYVESDYGDYFYYANAYTEADESPSSEDTYGKRLLSISGDDFLQAEDTNLAVGTAKVNYEYYKLPRRGFKLLCRYLFQLNLADKIYVTCTEPFVFTDLPCKIVGIELDVDNFTLDLDCEEIL